MLMLTPRLLALVLLWSKQENKSDPPPPLPVFARAELTAGSHGGGGRHTAL